MLSSVAKLAGAVLAGLILAVAAPMAAYAQGGTIRDSEIEATLRSYADPLLRAANIAPEDVKIIIVNDSSMNAFVAGGQNIFLHTGLILAAENPNQLKGVIAHEIGHIAGGHLVRSREAIGRSMGPALISIGLGVLAIAAGAPDAGAALISGSQQFAAANFFRFTKTQESAADQAGAAYLEATGQSGRGLMGFFDKFRYQEVLSEPRRNPYFRTHPLSSDRIESLRKRIEASPHADAPDSPGDWEAFRRMQAKLFGFLETPARTLNRYPRTDTGISARYARAISALRSADIGGAVRETDELIKLEPNNPYFYELKGQILFEAGRAEEAIPPLRQAAKLVGEDALIQVALARALAAGRSEAQLREAVELLQGALQLEEDNAFAWRELASAYDKLGQSGLARLASAEQAYAVGDMETAQNFAERAKRELTEDTPAWRRASDIATIAETERKVRRGRS